MRRFVTASLLVVGLAMGGSTALADDAAASAEVQGRVLILKEVSKEPESVNAGGLIVVEISDSGSRPPQEMKVDAGKSTALGHVRGVATNREGKSLMGGGYTWYLFKAPADERSVEIEASYIPNGVPNPKPMKRHYKVQIEK